MTYPQTNTWQILGPLYPNSPFKFGGFLYVTNPKSAQPLVPKTEAFV